MSIVNNEHCSINGGNFYSSYGIMKILSLEIQRLKFNNPRYQEPTVSIWNLSNANLADIIAFIENKNNTPQFIFCKSKYIHIFKNSAVFQNTMLVESELSVINIRNKFRFFLRTGKCFSEKMAIGTLPYLSFQQRNLGRFLLEGHTTSYCARLLSLPLKSISYHKRVLMRALSVHSNQELITILKMFEQFNRQCSW